MTTPVLATSEHVVGAPYCGGDPVTVEHEDVWRNATVQKVERVAGPGRFGLVWSLRVCVEIPTGYVYMTVRVDDNGRNHTYRHQVLPR